MKVKTIWGRVIFGSYKRQPADVVEPQDYDMGPEYSIETTAEALVTLTVNRPVGMKDKEEFLQQMSEAFDKGVRQWELGKVKVVKRLDRKYRAVVVKNNGTAVPEEEVIIFRALDMALPMTLHAYERYCTQLGCDETHLSGIRDLRKRVLDYQENNIYRCKVPDTSLDDLDS